MGIRRIRRIKKVKEITSTENNNSKVDDTPMVNLFNEIFEGQSVRIVDKDGDPWFVAKDICGVLGLTNPSMVCVGLDNDEKVTINITDSVGKPHKLLIISESGLYHLVSKSIKPIAKEFSRWIRKELLPKYRKHGHVESKQRTSVPTLDTFDQLEWMERTVIVMKSEREARLKQEQRINDISDDVMKINNIISENKRQLSLLPPSDLEVNKTKRSLLNQRVRSYSKATNTQFQTAWNKVYTEYYYTYGVNIKVRAKNRGMEYLDYASSEGLMDNLYAIACEYLKLEGEI